MNLLDTTSYVKIGWDGASNVINGLAAHVLFGFSTLANFGPDAATANGFKA